MWGGKQGQNGMVKGQMLLRPKKQEVVKSHDY